MTREAQITVTNNHGSTTLAAFRTVFVSIDHATMVAAKRSRSDGKDLWVEYRTANSSVGLECHVERPNTTTTRVYFCLRNSIAPSASDGNFYLRWGGIDSFIDADVRRLSRRHLWWLSGEKPFNDKRQAFLFFDDFQHKYSGGTFYGYSDGEDLDDDIYELGDDTKMDVRASSDPRLRMQLDTAGNYALAAGQGGSAILDSPFRIRAEVKIDSGATDPTAGLLAFGQGCCSEVLGAAGCVLGDYSTIGLVEKLQTGDTTLNSAAVTVTPDEWTPHMLQVQLSGGTINLGYEYNWGQDTAMITGSIAAPTYTTGFAGVFQDGDGASKHVHFRNLMIEYWDGVDDADWSASVTVPSVSFPTIYDTTTESVDYGVDRSPYPKMLSVRAAARRAHDTGDVQLTWSLMHPLDFYELIAFNHSKTGEAFSLTLRGASSASYRIIPGSLNCERDRGQYRAQIRLQKVAG